MLYRILNLKFNETYTPMAKHKTHVCLNDNCGKTFQKASRLLSHSRSHTGEMILRIDLIHPRLPNLSNHLQINTNQPLIQLKKPYSCTYDYCLSKFKRSDHLRRHILFTHRSENDQGSGTPHPVFSCDEEGCTAKFRSAQNLKKHIRRSHEPDSFKCHLCGEVFKKHHQLTTHRARHSQGTRNVCSVEGCGKSFKFPNKLRLHMKTHEGYVCKESECGEKFEKWTLLVKHNKLKHQTVHQCSICEKKFKQKQWLKQHVLVHADKRTVYSCTYENCGREYLDLRNLKTHFNSYHGGQRFPCNQTGCGQTFSTKQKLHQHAKLHDPTRPLPQKKKPRKKLIAEKLTGCSAVEVACDETDFVLNSPHLESRDTCDLSHLNIPMSCNLNLNIHERKETGCKDEHIETCCKDECKETGCKDERKETGCKDECKETGCKDERKETGCKDECKETGCKGVEGFTESDEIFTLKQRESCSLEGKIGNTPKESSIDDSGKSLYQTLEGQNLIQSTLT